MFDQVELPFLRAEFEPEIAAGQVELGPVEVVVDDLVAAFDVDVVAVLVAAGLFLAGQQMRDVDLVLDDHRLVQVPDDGLRRGVAVAGVVLRVDSFDQVEVAARVLAGAELHQVVEAPNNVAGDLPRRVGWSVRCG